MGEAVGPQFPTDSKKEGEEGNQKRMGPETGQVDEKGTEPQGAGDKTAGVILVDPPSEHHADQG